MRGPPRAGLAFAAVSDKEDEEDADADEDAEEASEDGDDTTKTVDPCIPGWAGEVMVATSRW